MATRVGEYTILSRLNVGNTATVYRATPPAAVKIVEASRISPAIHREVSVHATLEHPNIAHLLHVAPVIPSRQDGLPVSASSASSGGSSDDEMVGGLASGVPPRATALAIVTELLPRGDLFDEMQRRGSGGADAAVLARRVARDVAVALAYLHGRGVVHGDVKLENVGLSGSGVAKLIDFGSCRHAGHPPVRTVSPVGTAQYLAPELLMLRRSGRGQQRQTSSGATQPTQTADAWALGVLLYAMLAGHYPFGEPRVAQGVDEGVEEEGEEEKEEQERLEEGEKDEYCGVDAARRAIVYHSPPALPGSVPQDLREIVDGLLKKDPADRMTVESVVKALEADVDGSVSTGKCSGSQLVESDAGAVPGDGEDGVKKGVMPGYALSDMVGMVQGVTLLSQVDGEEKRTEVGNTRQSVQEMLAVVEDVQLQLAAGAGRTVSDLTFVRNVFQRHAD